MTLFFQGPRLGLGLGLGLPDDTNVAPGWHRDIRLAQTRLLQIRHASLKQVYSPCFNHSTDVSTRVNPCYPLCGIMPIDTKVAPGAWRAALYKTVQD